MTKKKKHTFTPIPYKIWIEAEYRVEGSWNPVDGNTDVIVTLGDGSKWVATFFTFQNIQSLIVKNQQTGECMSGAYFWASDMILIDEVSRERITEVIRHLLDTGSFETVFSRIDDRPVEEVEDLSQS